MLKNFFIGLIVAGLANGAFAQESAFSNNMLGSFSIISPSQMYQVNEAQISVLAIQSSLNARYEDDSEIEAKGLVLGWMGIVALSDSVKLGLNLGSMKTKTLEEYRSSELMAQPSLSFTFTEGVTLAASAKFASGAESGTNLPRTESSSTTYTVGLTLNDENSEGTMVYSTKNIDDKKPQNEVDASAAIGFRYRFNDLFKPGVIYTLNLSNDKNVSENSSRLGVIIESNLNEIVGVEALFALNSNYLGVRDADSREVGLLVKIQCGENSDYGELTFGGSQMLSKSQLVNSSAIGYSLSYSFNL
ncbi:MAG: hypothetical protein EOP48_00450 [Sphingobacteriales bacterium]|nr:MAG: hypothetical protein EOP48_00450 [Sphingobacteriales bacterium]